MVFGDHHLPRLRQRIPVLQDAPRVRQRQQALGRKAVTCRGKYALGIGRHRHARVEAADRRRGGTLFKAVAKRERGDRQAMRHMARQELVRPRAPPVGLRLDVAGQLAQGVPAGGAKRKTFGIDRRAAAGGGQRRAQQVGDVGQAGTRLHLPVDPAQAFACHQFKLAARVVLQPDAGRRFPSVCHFARRRLLKLGMKDATRPIAVRAAVALQIIAQLPIRGALFARYCAKLSQPPDLRAGPANLTATDGCPQRPGAV
jgi:hypothetical protein